MRRQLAVVMAASCSAAPSEQRSRGPDSRALPLVDADAPDSLPDQEQEATFIVPPSREDPSRDQDCGDNGQVWCAVPSVARPLDAARGKTNMDCPTVIQGHGPNESLEGHDALPSCAIGHLDLCHTKSTREANFANRCCYTWSCPTH